LDSRNEYSIRVYSKNSKIQNFVPK
jgi:hypothetical protein